MESEGRYLYCLIEADKELKFGPLGIGRRGDEVYTINYQDIGAVVSNTPLVVYHPRKENILAHQKVISTVMASFDLLPLSFGTILKNHYEVLALLEKSYVQVKETFQKTNGKIELGLKIFWKKEAFAKEMGNASREIIKLKRRLLSVEPEKRYQLAIQLGELVEEATEQARIYYLKEIYEPLRFLAVDSCLNPLLNERMLLNAAFLVNKEQEKEFDEAVNEFYLKHQEHFYFKYSGPWPPYNFVEIQLKS